MRILVVAESGTWVEDQIVGSLRDDGHAVHVFHHGSSVGEFYTLRRRAERASRNRNLVDRARCLASSSGLDLIFCYIYDDFLEVPTAKALRDIGPPLVNYNVDMTNQWYRQIKIAPYFTRMLCAQKANMRLLSRYNPNTLYFPMAARAATAAGDDAQVLPDAVTFVGAPTPYRHRVLGKLERSGVPVAVFGKGWTEGRMASPATGWAKFIHDTLWYAWPKFRGEGTEGLWRAIRRRLPHGSNGATQLNPAVLHGFVTSGTLNALYRGSAINLGVTRMVDQDTAGPAPTQVKLRDFEVPLAGGFYLSEHVAEYAEHFVIGSEVETWASEGELIEKARYYLAHPDTRQAVAAAGRRRAQRDHTWSARFADLFGDLDLKT